MKRATVLGVMGVLAASAIAVASIADDFKDAAGKKGCEAIPYSSERGTCTSASRDVDDWCKSSSRRWSCDDLDPTGLNRNIENVTNKINELKKQRDDLDYKKNNTSNEDERKEYERQIEELKAQIAEFERKVEEWKRQLNEEKSEAARREEIGTRCVQYRVAVQKIFADMKDKVQRETDPDAKQYISTLVGIYSDGEKGHQEAIDITNVGIAKCHAMR